MISGAYAQREGALGKGGARPFRSFASGGVSGFEFTATEGVTNINDLI